MHGFFLVIFRCSNRLGKNDGSFAGINTMFGYEILDLSFDEIPIGYNSSLNYGLEIRGAIQSSEFLNTVNLLKKYRNLKIIN